MTEKVDEYLERILRCAGSSLRHYVPQSKETLRSEMTKIIVEYSQWQPIATAPRDGTIIDLLTLGGSIAANEWWIDDDGESFWSCDYDDKFITHWRPVMPLPSPPTTPEE
jgi:hypothetical protein